MIDKIETSLFVMEEQKIFLRAEINWKKTLDKLWPLTSNEKPNSAW